MALVVDLARRGVSMQYTRHYGIDISFLARVYAVYVYINRIRGRIGHELLTFSITS